MTKEQDKLDKRIRCFMLLAALGIAAVIVVFGLMTSGVRARDLDGRFAASPLKPWFDSLRSGRGPCCSDADGTAVSDPDWETKDGHYRVRIGGIWIVVPDDALITEPNRVGRAMVWPVYHDGLPAVIRCFMPGSMT
jgi:hypothetical protein